MFTVGLLTYYCTYLYCTTGLQFFLVSGFICFFIYIFSITKKAKNFILIFSNKYYIKYKPCKLFTVYLMIVGDCDNNFVFINGTAI